MKIVALTAENVKKLVAVEIRPDGNLVQITGKNGQGKTSVLDSIWWCLAGAGTIQTTPIRKGQEAAKIRLDLGDVVVTRTFKAKEGGEFTTSIMVENGDGARFPSPQKMIDSFLGALTFDPLAFTRMSPPEQLEALRQFVPDVDFKATDKANKADFQARTDLNRQVRELSAVADAIVFRADLPETAIDESALVEELEKAGEANSLREQRISRREEAARQADSHRAIAESKRQEIEALRDRIADLEMQAVNYETAAKGTDERLASAEPIPEPIDTAAIRQRIDAARFTNGEIAKRDRKKATLASVAELETQAKALTKAMEDRKKDVAAKITAAKLPVEGIQFGDGELLLNGLPFDQASDAEQLRASIAIAMASNPKLRVIRVRDGSLLDEDAVKLLAEMADEKDYQVWIERVRSDGQVGFVLEDGHLKGAVE